MLTSLNNNKTLNINKFSGHQKSTGRGWGAVTENILSRKGYGLAKSLFGVIS